MPPLGDIESRDVALPYPLEAAQDVFVDYFRCPPPFAAFRTADSLSAEEEYFAFNEATGYGRRRGPRPAALPAARLHDVSDAVTVGAGLVELPFDLSDVVTNLRQELYTQQAGGDWDWLTTAPAVQHAYYFLRPVLPLPVRRRLQQVRLRGWERIPFPRWPVDFSVDTLMRNTLAVLLRSGRTRSIPFVWFWPDGAPSCAVMTHDVEGPVGRAFCGRLMDLDDSFEMKSAFQVVPERGPDWKGAVDQFRQRGFEVNVHDLNHDGYLFHDRPQFLERAARINAYTRELGCRGFRSGAMYREQQWFEAFEFSYDMSVPNVAHLEPQRGGCCTVMPYFVGDILELPLTTVQDYSLFHILDDYSTAMWKSQIDLIRAMNGFISFITHPDYLVEPRARAVYTELLAHLQRLRCDGKLWVALPGDVDRWWRSRRQMTLVRRGHSWAVEGPDAHRARLAYATLDGDRVVYSVASGSAQN
ncbi:MAG TPA: hypothetical protein VGF24_34425 [Vicinamibacterales bacterium]|jgi:hypothetical protein